MIPGKIVRFLHEHANMAFGGIRHRDLRPAGCRVSAWQVGADGRTLTAWVPVPEAFRANFLDALLDNRQFALTVEEHPAHETYQLKGLYLRHRDATADDRTPVERQRERLTRVMRSVAPPGFDVGRVVAIMHPDPTYVIEIDVREVFLQTPGPGAGRRLYPEAEGSQ
jgi:hypothetical protein